jgi:hypothetical protein
MGQAVAVSRQRVSRLCLAVSAANFRAWHAKGAERRIVYAQGPSLDQGCEVAILVREMIAAGRLRAFHERRQDGGGWNFIAERIDVAIEAQPSGEMDQLTGDQVRVLAVLSHYAGAGLPCPTNSVLAREARVRDGYAARYIVRRLADAGRIRVENRGPRLTRIVTIIATGERTSCARLPVGKGFARTRGSAKERAGQ